MIESIRDLAGTITQLWLGLPSLNQLTIGVFSAYCSPFTSKQNPLSASTMEKPPCLGWWSSSVWLSWRCLRSTVSLGSCHCSWGRRVSRDCLRKWSDNCHPPHPQIWTSGCLHHSNCIRWDRFKRILHLHSHRYTNWMIARTVSYRTRWAVERSRLCCWDCTHIVPVVLRTGCSCLPAVPTYLFYYNATAPVAVKLWPLHQQLQ